MSRISEKTPKAFSTQVFKKNPIKKSTKVDQKVTHTNTKYLNAIRKSDQALLAEIYQIFLPKIKTYIYRNSGTSEDARDIFQEALIVIYKKTQDPDFNVKSSFGAYLMTVCKNLWLNQLRKNSRIDKEYSIESYSVVMDKIDSIDELMVTDEKTKLFIKLFKTLPLDAQKVLNLFFEGKKMKEIAKIMGYSSEGYAKKKKCVFQKKLINLIQSDPLYIELV